MQPDICLNPPQWIETRSASDICSSFKSHNIFKFGKYTINFSNNDIVIEYTNNTSVTKTEVINNPMENGKIVSKKYSNIMFHNRNILLVRPIEFLIEQEDGAILISNSFLNIYAYGNSQENAEKEMYSQFQIVWEMFTSKTDEQLDEQGIEIKNYLLSLGDLK